jgi:hypothetical protein
MHTCLDSSERLSGSLVRVICMMDVARGTELLAERWDHSYLAAGLGAGLENIQVSNTWRGVLLAPSLHMIIPAHQLVIPALLQGSAIGVGISAVAIVAVPGLIGTPCTALLSPVRPPTTTLLLEL